MKEKERKSKKEKKKRNGVIRVKTSRLPFCHAEKKEFTTSCRHRFPVSLRPRRGRQSNLRIERANAGKRARGCARKSFDSPRSEEVTGAAVKGRFSLNGREFSWPPCIGAPYDIHTHTQVYEVTCRSHTSQAVKCGACAWASTSVRRSLLDSV